MVQVGTDSYVFRVKPDNTVERADVEVGTRREGLAEIVKGLQVGDVIVIDGTGKLRVGNKIQAAAANAPAKRQGEPAAAKGGANG